MKHLKIVNAATIMHYFAVGGKKMAFTNGCFDMFHAGHACLLQSIKEDLPDDYELVVGVNGDESVKKNKGPDRPIISQEQRAFLVACHECVDHVFVFNEETVSGYLRHFKPSRWYKGGDYSIATLHPSEKASCGQTEVFFIPFSEDISATKIITKIKEL
tara:strand:+ start:161 stop:637 length:477 start_codon:yes stop_codon:yes gene_type:complete